MADPQKRVPSIGTDTTINSGDMEAILMIAVKRWRSTEELRQEKEELKQTLETLKADNADLKARLEALERLVKDTQTARSEATK